MGKSRNPNMYSDVAAVLDAVIASGGQAVYTSESPAAAHGWRARAYQLRLLLRDLQAQTLPPGLAPTTKYDHLILKVDTANPCNTIIEIRKPAGTLAFPDGTPIEIAQVRDVQRDPLEDEMQRLLKGL